MQKKLSKIGMLQDFKTEIKLFLLVALIAVAVSVAGILLLRGMTPAFVEQAPPIIQQTPPPAPSSQPQVEQRGIFSPHAGEEWQIGKAYTVRWEPSSPNDLVVLRLHNNDKVSSAERLVFEPSNMIPDIGEYSFTVRGFEPGDTYQFVILKNGRNENLASFEFSIVVDASDWQTYRNDEFGFEVRYPSDIFALVPAEEYIYPDSPPRYDGMKLIFAGVVERLGKKECRNELGDFAIVCDAGEENGISFVVVKKGLSHFTREGDPGEGEKEITIGGRKSLRYMYGLEGDNTEHYYIPIEAEQTVIITVKSTFNYESREHSPSEEIVNQILSTFRFVE